MGLEGIGVALRLSRLAQILADHRLAVGAPVRVVLEKVNLPRYDVVVDHARVVFRAAVIVHPHNAAVVHIAVAGIVAVDVDHAGAYIGDAAGQYAAHELLAAAVAVAILKDQLDVRIAPLDLAAAIADQAGHAHHDARADHIDSPFDRAVFDRAAVGIAGQPRREAVAVVLNVDMNADQLYILHRGVLEHGKQAGECGVVFLLVAVECAAAIRPRLRDGQVVDGMAAAVERAGKGDRNPLDAAHIQIVHQPVCAARIAGDGFQPFHIVYFGAALLSAGGGICENGEQKRKCQQERKRALSHRRTLPLSAARCAIGRSDAYSDCFIIAHFSSKVKPSAGRRCIKTHHCRAVLRISADNRPETRFFDSMFKILIKRYYLE